MCISVLLPAPDFPNSAVMPGVGASKLASMENSARSSRSVARSMLSAPAAGEAGAPATRMQ